MKHDQITEVSVEYGRTVNLGNYESERLHVGLTASVGADDDAQVVTYELVEQARGSVERHLVRLRNLRQGVRRFAPQPPGPDYASEGLSPGEDDDSDPETTRRMGDGH